MRTGPVADDEIELEAGTEFTLTAQAVVGDPGRVSTTLPELARWVSPGDEAFLADGAIVLRVTRVDDGDVVCEVVRGGVLRSRKGMHVPRAEAHVQPFTDQDLVALRMATSLRADFLGLSFVRHPEDVEGVRARLPKRGARPMLVAKIETAAALDHLPGIVAAADAVMVARGDLGIQVPARRVPLIQKEIIRFCNMAGKPVITATQMLESMTRSPLPTRAEVNDVANAVLDGTDAVMLSAETASGKYPVDVIEAMDRICREVEQTQPLSLDQEFLNRVFTRVDQSIAMAALFTAYHLKVKAIASLTESGSTALWMSRMNSGVPIYALTSQTVTRYRCALFRDVFPIIVKYVGHDREELLREAEKVLVENNVVKEGDIIVLTIGEPIGKSGGTNTMKIVKVGEHLKP
jgi:pyruvate kinase